MFVLNEDPDPGRPHPQKLESTGWPVGKVWQRSPGTASKRGRVGKGRMTLLLTVALQPCHYYQEYTSPVLMQLALQYTYTPLQEFPSAFKDRCWNVYAWLSRSDSSVWWKSFCGRKSKKKSSDCFSWIP